MRTKAFGAKSAFDSAAIAALSRGMETLRIRPPPAAAVAFSIVRRVSFGADDVGVMGLSLLQADRAACLIAARMRT